jgi:3-dehydroshikimate dehydratase
VPELLLNTIALDPNRWTPEKVAHFDLVDLLPTIAEAGFDALEVWQYHLSRLTDERVAALGERARALGVTFPVVGFYPVLHLEREEREREWEEMAAMIARSAALGARVVKMFAGRLGSNEADDEAFERSVAFAQEMAEAAAEHGVTLTAETHPDTLCDSVPAARRFLDAVAAPNLRVCFQPFDFTRTEQTLADYRALS